MAPELETVDASDRSEKMGTLGAVVRAALGVLSSVLLLPIWWSGQGCIDDPCALSTVDEWRGVIAVVVFGALFLRIASSRYWRKRVGLWVVTLAPALWFYRGLEPVNGGSVTTEAADVSAAALVLLGAHVVMAIFTLVIEIVAARSST